MGSGGVVRSVRPSPRRGCATCVLALAAVAAAGCASHHGERYAFAPPYAPPVYPQPPAQPVAYAAPAAALPAGAIPPGAVAAGSAVAAAPVAGMTAEGLVVPAGSPCPPCEAAGMVSGQPVLVEGGGQTPPCPPGP